MRAITPRGYHVLTEDPEQPGQEVVALPGVTAEDALESSRRFAGMHISFHTSPGCRHNTRAYYAAGRAFGGCASVTAEGAPEPDCATRGRPHRSQRPPA